jgi:hypothetical protein
MVHALELIHAMLLPDGMLIDIHPTGEPPEVVAILAVDGFPRAKKYNHLGYLQESDDFVEYPLADQALAQAVSAGWYRLEKQREFCFLTTAANSDELRRFIQETWSDGILGPEIESQQPVQMCEPVRISRLRRLA